MKTYTEIPDWIQLRERYCAFWQNKCADETIIAHIQNPSESPPKPETWMQYPDENVYLNPEKLFKLKAWRRSSWDWHMDLFLYTTPAYGPNLFSGFIGGQPAFGKDSVWHEQLIDSLDESERLHFDTDNCYWKKYLEISEYFSMV